MRGDVGSEEKRAGWRAWPIQELVTRKRHFAAKERPSLSACYKVGGRYQPSEQWKFALSQLIDGPERKRRTPQRQPSQNKDRERTWELPERRSDKSPPVGPSIQKSISTRKLSLQKPSLRETTESQQPDQRYFQPEKLLRVRLWWNGNPDPEEN